MRIAINTGGGDAPGLNAVIRAAALAAEERGWEVLGIRRGYDGLFEEDGVISLDRRAVRGITHRGGTILGTSNSGNPFKRAVTLPDGSVELQDQSQDVLDRFKELGVDCLIAIGGDGSLSIANGLAKGGLNVIGVPKTIDNDLAATAVTFGFHTAVDTATEAIDKLHSTAESHRRVMVVELMGRYAGWIALFAGLGATADVILIPEIPYDIDRVCEKIQARYENGRGFAIVVAAEGAKPKKGQTSYLDARTIGGPRRLGGLAQTLADQIGERTGRECRSLVLGHLQRGGQPIAYDRILSLRFGVGAVELAEQGKFGCMVALDPPDIKAVPLQEAIDRLKLVPLDGDIVRTARTMGISFGD